MKSTIDILNFRNWKIKNTFIFFSVVLVVIISLLISIIIKYLLEKNLTTEMLDNSTMFTQDLSGQLIDAMIAGEEYRLANIIFDSKESHKNIAYIIVLDRDGNLKASTFLGRKPQDILNAHNSIFQKSDVVLINSIWGQIYDVAVKLDYDKGVVRIGYIKQKIDNVINSILATILISLSIPLVITVLFAIIFSHLILMPINTLKQAVQRITQGDLNKKIEINNRDEIGELAQMFNQMTSELKKSRDENISYSATLEMKVAESTERIEKVLEQLQEDKSQIEKQRAATLNILEDVQESREELKIANANLERKRFELESLNGLSDKLVGAVSVEEGIIIINEFLDKVLDYDAATFAILDPLKKENLVFRSYLKNSVNQEIIDKASYEIKKFLEYHADKVMKASMEKFKDTKPAIFGAKIVKRDIKYENAFIFPLVINEQFLGALHILSFKGDAYKQKDGEESIRAMMSTFSMALARLQALNQMQQSKTESLVRSLSDGVIMFSAENEILLVNHPAMHLLGVYSPPKLISDLTKDFSDFDIKSNIDKAMKSGEIVKIEEVRVRRMIYEIFITPVKDYMGKTVAGAIVFHDITHIKEIDRMKTEFVSVASHQLRTPLTAIKLFTEMLLDESVGKLNDDQKQYMESIFQSTDRMVRLVNDLLNLSRLESGRLKVEPVPVQLIDFLQKTIESVQPIADSRKCQIIFKDSNKIFPEISLDPNLFGQVIHNLLTNAIRYTPEGKGMIEVGISRSSGYYTIRVSDNGIGIAEKDQPRIFEKFFRADNAIITETEGTGLGLYVCKMIMGVLGGNIWFTTQKNEGTIFTVTIPDAGVKPRVGDKSLAI